MIVGHGPAAIRPVVPAAQRHSMLGPELGIRAHGHPRLAKARKVWLTAAHQSRVPEAGRAQPKVRARSIEMNFNRTLFAGIGDSRNSKPAAVQYSR
jgi:hypothetical protein